VDRSREWRLDAHRSVVVTSTLGPTIRAAAPGRKAWWTVDHPKVLPRPELSDEPWAELTYRKCWLGD
jgi:hypothetical protein